MHSLQQYSSLRCSVHYAQIKARAADLGLDIDFRGAIDHLSPEVHGYKVLATDVKLPVLLQQVQNPAFECRFA